MAKRPQAWARRAAAAVVAGGQGWASAAAAGCSLAAAPAVVVDCTDGPGAVAAELVFRPLSAPPDDSLELVQDGSPAGSATGPSLLAGDDRISFAASASYTSTLSLATVVGAGPASAGIDLGTGADRVEVFGASVVGAVGLGAGDDAFVLSLGDAGDVAGGDGDDRIDMLSGGAGHVDGGNGDDIVRLGDGGAESVSGGDGNDTITLSLGSFGAVDAGAGDDAVTLADASAADVLAGAGNDTVLLYGGYLFGNRTTATRGELRGGAGDDVLEVHEGRAWGIYGDDGADRILLEDTSADPGSETVVSEVRGGAGDDEIVVRAEVVGDAAAAGSGVFGDDGNDSLTLAGGAYVGGDLSGGAGDDVIDVVAGIVLGDVLGDAGDDRIGISGFAVPEAEYGYLSDIGGDVDGGAGADAVVISGGRVRGNVSAEQVTVTGGAVDGSIVAASISLAGGSVGGDLLGLGPDTLAIAGPATLSDGARVSGTGTVGTITGASLPGLRFEGFARLTLTRSAMGLVQGGQGIQELALSGSTLWLAPGATSLGGGSGTLDARASAIEMRNGVAGDVLRVGGARLDATRLGLDVDARTGTADRIEAGTVASAARGTVAVALLGKAPPPAPGVVAILPVAGETAPGVGGPASAAFALEPVAGPTYGELLAGSRGGLYLEVGPDVSILAASDPVGPGNAATAEGLRGAVQGFGTDVLDRALGRRGGSAAWQVSETFILLGHASASYLRHDGFAVDGPGWSVAGAPFTARERALVAGGELDVAKAGGLADGYRLRVGAFAGYLGSDASLEATDAGGIPLPGGSAAADGGIAGAYVVAARGAAYMLASLGGYWGGTDVENGALGSSGSYDARGWVLALTGGRAFPIGDGVGEGAMLDLRGSAGYVSLRGDAFTDSAGFAYGTSEASYGYVSFEPGVATTVAVGGGLLRPYLRAAFAGRIGSENSGSFAGTGLAFGDDDLWAAATVGADYAVRQDLTIGGAVTGGASGDYTAVSGNLRLTLLF